MELERGAADAIAAYIDHLQDAQDAAERRSAPRPCVIRRELRVVALPEQFPLPRNAG